MTTGDVVALADGRLGISLRYQTTSVESRDRLLAQMGNGTFILSAFYTFERSDEGLMLDEMFLVCIGECDAAWDELANGSHNVATPNSTPGASPDANDGGDP